ncbi:hypothetical protein J7I98_33915 [Streptomyces sp. ISL-98]|uniref:hypothetical protein n=1 Tax=Streptomyces sp. ISL-98 TaxID=2819192 RepID=UPI001BEAA68C|nr:hypothetical protein [Streptomyces sp. ISL-98]MBT2510736.1 hypothetical protein [Streptomyces sp. ISL-98]
MGSHCDIDLDERRLARLSAGARLLLEVAVVLDRPFTLYEAADILGRRAVELLACAEETLQMELLAEDGEKLVLPGGRTGHPAEVEVNDLAPLTTAKIRVARLVAKGKDPHHGPYGPLRPRCGH